MDLTASTAALADAASRLARLLPARAAQPAHTAATLAAGPDGLLLTGTDGEATARVRVAATVHGPGRAAVGRRALADTLAPWTRRRRR